MSRHRSISALLVDVPAGHAAQLTRVLDDAGWTARSVPVQGTEALSAALQRRGWDAVLYGGDGPLAVPSRKALEMVRLADPHLPFLAVSPRLRPGSCRAILRGAPGAASRACPTSSAAARRADPRARAGAHAPPRRRRAQAARRAAGDRRPPRRRPGARAPCATACSRRSATSLGWTFGAVWRPDGAVLRCTTLWTAPGARGGVAELAGTTHEQHLRRRPGPRGPRLGLPPPGLARASCRPRRSAPGLVTAAAFPIALGDECVGVIELYAGDVREPNAEVSALFATVGGQLAAYFARRRVRARARRSFDGAAALIVALDTDGRVEIANGTACAAFGFEEDDLVGRDWFAVAVPEPERAAARAAYAALLAGEGTELPATPEIAWRWSLSARRRRARGRRARLGRAGPAGD